MAPTKSCILKLTPIVTLLVALAASTGCGPMPREARVAYAAPALVEMSSGVWAVQDYPGYYYANGGYWYFADDGVWYERPYWGGPWASVDARIVPRGIPALGAAQPSGSVAIERPPAPPFASTPAASQEAAHRLVIEALACWLGGVWSDAEGASEPARAADSEQRCHSFVARVYGTDDKVRYERLRAVEPVEVSELKDKVLAAAQNDAVDAARWPSLATLLDSAANAERETLFARRAGDRVKMDLDGGREPSKLSADELGAVAPLSESKAFEALFRADLGELTHEARAIAILAAMDRMEIARGLSKHLKVYALDKPFTDLFGVAAPSIPADALKPLKGGAWLAYLSSVAEAAGHPVPARAQSLADRELLAWGGALAGLADKLRTETSYLSDATELKRVAQAVVRRLDVEYRASEAAALLEPEPAQPPRHLGLPPHASR